MTRIRLTGGAYQARSVVASAQRQLNLISEPLPAALGEPAPVALYPTPGLRPLVVLPQGPVRGIRTTTSGAVYVVAGAGVYAMSAAWVPTPLGTITAGLTTPVSMADNGITMVIVDGSPNGWQVTLASNAFARIVDATGSFRGGDRADYLDTFLLFNVPGTPQFMSSNSLAVTFDALAFANKESYSDLLVSLIVAKREIWLLGSETTEVWYNTGGFTGGALSGNTFPFESMPGVFINRGCAAKYSVAETDNAVYWLSQDRYGQGIILQGAGYAATRISTYAIEAALAGYATLADAVGYTYQLAGHVYYVLSFPTADKTWVYDVTTKLWHELAWLDSNGAEHRHRGNCAAAAYGVVACGDWQNGNLYALDPAVFTDNGAPIKRLRAFPHLLADGKRVFYRQFLADMETGTTLTGTALTSAPSSVTPGTPAVDPALAGPLISAGGLITNSFNNTLGRGGYFHWFSGTSEGQSLMIYAAYLCNEVLTGGTVAQQASATWFRSLAEAMLDGMHTGTNPNQGAMLRQPIPTDPNTICLLHWLFAARGDIPTQIIAYAYGATRSGSSLTITGAASSLYTVWSIYPATSQLLYNSPYSPAFDIAAPATDTSFPIAAGGWHTSGADVLVTIPAGAPGGVTAWKICYGSNGGPTIPQGFAEEAYPSWALLADGYAACAPDTFRWTDFALSKAIVHDARAGKAANWTNLQAASRRTAVRGQALSDLRQVLMPLPGFDAIPLSGNPTGMFCYSNHPAALPPPAPQLALGANAGWIGYSFWSRDAGGDIIGTVPAATGAPQVQIGRGFNDNWRTVTSYQDPDQYLWVQMSCSHKPGAGENVYVFVSSTQSYSAATRWYANVGAYPAFVAQANSPANVFDLLIPITDLLSKDGPNTVLPADTPFQNFGVSFQLSGAYTARIRFMRLLSGVSAAWVLANLAKAKQGSQLPFAPGCMPFAINADTIRQQFVGFNGSPFQGYQQPDFWYQLGTDAAAVHPSLAASDLPVASATGVVSFPISLTNANTTAKPANALLMEQQLIYLQSAQAAYVTAGGTLGPFAHTFVWNTAARDTLASPAPTPNTWIWTNNDPNTRWSGYQVRVVESLGRVCYKTVANPAFGDCYGLAHTMLVAWLNRLNTIWPNLNPKATTDPGTGFVVNIRGMPTDWGNPTFSALATISTGPPQALYEEPHGVMLVARACLWLKLADPTQTTLCDALITRCWTYLETLWITATGPMMWTWSTDAAGYLWFGFWSAEILATMALFLQHPAALPAGISTATLAARIVSHQIWIAGQATTGSPVLGTVALDPSHKMFLDWSDDRGRTFGNPIAQDLGATGEYLTSIQFQRLGMARDRVFRLSWSCASATILQGAWIDATPAQS